MQHDPLEWVALAMLLGVVTFLVYLVVFIHDIPYQMAKKRHHPQQDAIFVGCWLSLFTLHLMWPLLFLWAVSRGGPLLPPEEGLPETNETTSDRLARLEATLVSIQANCHDSSPQASSKLTS